MINNKAAPVLNEADWPGLEPAVAGPTFAYLKKVEVLRRRYFEDLFVTEDDLHDRYLALLADENEDQGYDVFIVAPLSDEQLKALRGRTLPIRSVLTADIARVRVVLEYVAADGYLACRSFVPTRGLPDDVLPPPHAVLETYRQYLERVHPEMLKAK